MALNLIGSFQQGQAARQYRRDVRALEAERARETETRNRLAELLRGGLPTTPEEGRAMGAEIGAITGDPGVALDWQRHFAAQPEDVLAQRQAQAPFVVAEMGTVTDQAGYDRALGRLTELGVDVSDFPPGYDPNQTNMVVQSARYLAEGPPKAAGGPFAGTGMQAQAANMLLTGDPSSPEYRAAYNIMAQPRTSFDVASGQMFTVTPDMSAYRPPAGGAAAVAAEAMGEPDRPEPLTAPGTAGVKVTKITEPKLTQEEKTAAGFANRIAEANTTLTELEDVGASIWREGAPYIPNWLKSEDWQKLEQAQREFINAQLRRESGAVISPEEFGNAAQQYFPQPGDEPGVVEQKRRSRELALSNMRTAAGRAKPKEPPKRPEAPEDLDFENMSLEELRRLAQ